MRSKIGGILVVLMVLIVPLGVASASVQITGQNAQSLTLKFNVVGIRDAKDAEGKWSGLYAKGFISTFDSTCGLYLPASSCIVAIPVGADVRCEVVDPSYYEVKTFDVGKLADAGLAAIPRKPAQIAARGYLGDQLVASLWVAPLVYDQAARALRVYTSFSVRFDFGLQARQMAPAVGPPTDSDSYEATLKSAVLNYEQGRNWRRRVPATLDASDYFSRSPSWIKIKVDTTGVYCVTGKDLAGLGVSTGSISAQTLRLYSGPGLPLNEKLSPANASWMRQVPIRVSRATGGLTDGDSIIFYGLGAHDWKNLYDSAYGSDEYNKNFYSDYNCYWLTWGGTFQGPVARIDKVNPPACEGCSPYVPAAFLERLHVEEDNVPDFTVPAEDGWYWRPMMRGSSAAFFVTTSSPDNSQLGRVIVRVADGHTSDQCRGACFRVIVRLNGTVIKDQSWPVGTPTVDVDSTATLANQGYQRLDIDVPTAPDSGCTSICDNLYLAWYEMFYWRKFMASGNGLFFSSPDTTATVNYVITGYTTPSLYAFDVTDQFGVKELKGAQVSGGPSFSVALLDTTSKGSTKRYAVVSSAAMRKPLEMSQQEITDVRDASGSAYLVITHKDLVGPAHRIADFHHGQVVTTDEIYNEFGWGVPDATAIRDFLRWRWTHGTHVERVLLFGDASWDLKGYLSYGSYHNYVPAYERRFLPPVDNPYATDDWFVYLEPAPGDSEAYWPTIPISRIPAASADEGDKIVSRILDYMTNPELGVWQNRIVIVADDDRKGTQCTDNGADDIHTIYAEELNDRAYPQVFDRAKVYLTEYPIESTGLKSLARKDFLKDLNEGVLIANYVGHGDQYRMAQEEVFNQASVGLVSAGRKLTFFIASSCNVSRFDEPANTSMLEELLRRDEGGTVGSLASTHLCLPQPNQRLNLNFVWALFDSSSQIYPTSMVGDAVQIAKVRTVDPYRSMTFWTNDEMYALLGDVALRLATPKLSVAIARANADTLLRRGTASFTATVMDGGAPAGTFTGSGVVEMREAENTDGYTTCSKTNPNHLDYEIPGFMIYRARKAAGSGAFAFNSFVPVDAREGVRGQVRCFVTDGQNSGAGLLDSLIIHGESPSEDNVGPEINLRAGGKLLQSGDSVAVAEQLTLELSDESGVAIKGKSQFIPAVSVTIDDGQRQDITDSVYSVDGGFTQSVATFEVPNLTVDSHKFTVTAFDNVNNLASKEYTLLVGSSGGPANNVVYAYPNPASDACYIICESDRRVVVDVTIYTVSGRKIWEQASPDAKAYNQILWGGADKEGDKVANGTYLVKVEARDPLDSGFSFSKTIAVALMR